MTSNVCHNEMQEQTAVEKEQVQSEKIFASFVRSVDLDFSLVLCWKVERSHDLLYGCRKAL